MGSHGDGIGVSVHKTLAEARAALGGMAKPALQDEPRTDGPRTNREPGELKRKQALRYAPHMAPLAEYVDDLRHERGQDRVPDFDPTEAGTRAPILILAEAPGPRATVERGGSGFVSPDNDDASAETMWRLFAEIGLDRATEVVTWNIVPSYLGDDSAIRAATTSDLEAARPAIQRLIGLLPDVRVVLLLGRKAQHGWSKLGIDLPVVSAPHPSPRNLNSRPDARGKLREAIIEARLIADYLKR